jgi:hypothetical protein
MIMMLDPELNKKVEATINSVDSIKAVGVSPFLKDRILNNINTNEAVESSIWSWFTPKLQFATLLILIMLNIYAYKALTSNDYNITVEEFVDTYNFGEETYTSIFN